jgi:hypothetical protein
LYEIIYALGSEAADPVQPGRSQVQHENHRKWWVGHVMGFYDSSALGSDNDDDDELGVPAVTLYDLDGRGESAGVWEEVIRDMAVQHGTDVGAHRSRTVLHELGHQFGLDNGGNHNGADYADTVMWIPVLDPVHMDDRQESWIGAMANHFEPIDIDTIRDQARVDPRFP